MQQPTPLLCSNSIDYIGRRCRDLGKHLYYYKKKAAILPLAFVDDLNGISRCGAESVHLNAFLNTQIELKKLSFHLPKDSSSGSKCMRMHVGQNKVGCPDLKVHNSAMADVTEITYLGDRISADGKNSRNIQDRTRKGIGCLSQIFKIMRVVNFDIETALLLREAIMISGMLTNSEVWFNLNNHDLEALEKVDRLYFQKLLGVPHTVPQIAIYLEFGVIPLAIRIKARRINYLHNILRSERSSMLYRVFIVQWHNPCKGDWTLQVKKDLLDFDIPCDLSVISSKSKQVFKQLVKESAKKYAFNYLMDKKLNYKKMSKLEYRSLETQSYLLDNKFTFEEKKLLFQYRTRMAKYAENFRGGKSVTVCPLCSNHIDSQFLILECPTILHLIEENSNIEKVESLNDLFSDSISYNTLQILKMVSEVRAAKSS